MKRTRSQNPRMPWSPGVKEIMEDARRSGHNVGFYEDIGTDPLLRADPEADNFGSQVVPAAEALGKIATIRGQLAEARSPQPNDRPQ